MSRFLLGVAAGVVLTGVAAVGWFIYGDNDDQEFAG